MKKARKNSLISLPVVYEKNIPWYNKMSTELREDLAITLQVLASSL